MASHLLNAGMSKFETRPARDVLQGALQDEAKENGVRFPAVESALLEGYRALDRMEGHLTDWDDGLIPMSGSDATPSRRQ